MINNWEELVDAIQPGAARRLYSMAAAEGWLLRAWDLPACPDITIRCVYRNYASAAGGCIRFPFTLDELRKVLKPEEVA